MLGFSIQNLPAMEHDCCFYEIEATSGNWSVRELQRQYGFTLYERLMPPIAFCIFWIMEPT